MVNILRCPRCGCYMRYIESNGYRRANRIPGANLRKCKLCNYEEVNNENNN